MARSTLRRTTPPPGSSTFCYWVKRWRSYRGVTQREFATLWGVSPSLVQKIEADDYSVSQLSFERLEALRALLELPSRTFYGLIATHPDVPADPSSSHAELLQVSRLEPNLAPLELPRTLLGDAAAAQLRAFAVTPADFATDRLRYSLRTGALVVLDTGLDGAEPLQKGEIGVATAQYAGQTCRILIPYAAVKPIFLRSFDAGRDRVLEPNPEDLTFLGKIVAYWVKLDS